MNSHDRPFRTTSTRNFSDIAVEKVEVSSYTIPTDFPESDGTIEWSKTTLVLVQVHAGGQTGIGYTYAGLAAATLIRESLVEIVVGSNAMSVTSSYMQMWRKVRKLGPARRLLDRNLGTRLRPLGPEGTPAQSAPHNAPRPGS